MTLGRTIVKSRLLEEILQNAEVGIVLYSEENICILKNKLFDRLLNLPESFCAGNFRLGDLIELCFLRGDYDTELTLDNALDFFDAKMRQETPFTLEIRATSGKWLELTYAPMRAKYSMFTYKDITAAKTYEKQVHWYESIVQSSENAVVTQDLNGQITSWNNGAKRLFGYQAEEVIGQHISILIPKELSLEAEEVLGHVFRDESVNPYDTIRIQKNGALIHVSVSVAPIHDKFGNVIGACKIARSIEDSFYIQSELELAQQVFLNVHEAIMVCDDQNKIVSVNPAFTKLTGYQFAEVQGKYPQLLSSGKHDSKFYSTMWKQIVETGNWDGEITNRKKNGEFFVEWLRISSAYKQDGSLHRRIAIFSDITERKRSEAKVWQAANYDRLTQLPNRDFFQTKLSVEIIASERNRKGFALLFLDLDKFKEVNDTYGHLFGDVLLRQVAQRITGCVRKSDLVSRLGGDEFTIVLTELVSVDKISEVAQKILDSLQAPFDLGLPGSEQTLISCSIGIALFPKHGMTDDELIRNADQAMYHSKRNGGGRFSYFSTRLNRH